MDEVALRRPVGGPALLSRQLEYLGELSQQPWLTWGLAASGQAPPAPGG